MPGPGDEVDRREHAVAAAARAALVEHERAPDAPRCARRLVGLGDRCAQRPARRARGIEHLEDVVGRGDALGGGVELHAHLAQRQVRLGREQQHEQPDAERERPVDAGGSRSTRR